MELVFVTNNPNKLNEIQSLVSHEISVKSLKDIDFHDEIDETELTLEGNALLKSRHIHSKFGLDCFADDTGLEIEALDGAPGVFSARYAGTKCNAQDNINKVLYELKDKKNSPVTGAIFLLRMKDDEVSSSPVLFPVPFSDLYQTAF